MYEQFIISSIFIPPAFPTWEITLLLQSLPKDLSIALPLHSSEHARKTELMWAGVWCRMQDVCLGPRPTNTSTTSVYPPALHPTPQIQAGKGSFHSQSLSATLGTSPLLLYKLTFIRVMLWCETRCLFPPSLFCTKHNTFCDQSARKIVCVLLMFCGGKMRKMWENEPFETYRIP